MRVGQYQLHFLVMKNVFQVFGLWGLGILGLLSAGYFPKSLAAASEQGNAWMWWLIGPPMIGMVLFLTLLAVRKIISWLSGGKETSSGRENWAGGVVALLVTLLVVGFLVAVDILIAGAI